MGGVCVAGYGDFDVGVVQNVCLYGGVFDDIFVTVFKFRFCSFEISDPFLVFDFSFLFAGGLFYYVFFPCDSTVYSSFHVVSLSWYVMSLGMSCNSSGVVVGGTNSFPVLSCDFREVCRSL